MKFTIRFLALLLLASSFTGCLTDTITGPQVVARLVYPPGQAWFRAINYQAPLADIVIRWLRSPSDTQLNFKGYYVQLWKSTNKIDTTTQITTSTLDTLIGTAHVTRIGNHIDTFVTFRGIASDPYTVIIKGQKSTDTLGYSRDSLTFPFFFDPRPLTNPTNLQAVAYDPQTVLLRWTPATTETNAGMLGYTVYRVDPGISNDTAKVVASLARGVSETSVGAPSATSTQGITNITSERAYRYFVKSVRNDSTYFDTTQGASIVWSGAERVPHTPTDTGSFNGGYSLILHTIFFGYQNGQWDVVEDSASTTGDAQIRVDISGQTVTLTPVGTTMLSSHVDKDSSLDLQFYSAPVDQSTYGTSPISLAPAMDTVGRILYVRFQDPNLHNAYEWARLFVHHQQDGTFINPARGGIDIQGRLQPGVNANGGNAHLPYY